MTPPYQSTDLVFIVPTKDRPQKMQNLMNSLAAQSVPFNRLIVVDGGESIEEIVRSFSNKFEIEYYSCHPPGQIRQRNLALSKLNEHTTLVGYLDDDLVLEPKALEEMIACWNRNGTRTAGISFHITNSPPRSPSWIKTLMGMDSSTPGRVLKSGYNSPLFPISEDVRTQWLCGGATVWRQDILLKYSQKDVKSRWAIGEDLTFSYPIGKIHPLMVCAGARVRHEHVYDHPSPRKFLYYGRNATLWHLNFVEHHQELKRLYFFWMTFCQILARIILGMVKFRGDDIEYALGQLTGSYIGLKAIISGKNIQSVAEE